MRILITVRLASGLRDSIVTGKWQPSGSPAIYKLIEGLQTSGHDVQLLLLDRQREAAAESGLIQLAGLDIPAWRLESPTVLQLLPRRLANVMIELSETLQVWRAARSFVPAAIYLDRSLLWPAGLLARFGQWPVVWRVLGVSPNLQEAWTGTRLIHIVMRWLMRAPFATVICSRDGSGGDVWLQRLLAPATPRVVLLNGVDQQAGDTSAAIDLPAGKTIVSFLGRLDRLKNLKLFVAGFTKAIAKEKDLHALIVGRGEEEAWLRQRISASDGNSFTFLPGVPHSQMPALLARTDIYVSLNAMGNLSNANLEAIRAGRCMVLPAPDLHSARDVDTIEILPDDTALRISMTDEALADALVRLHRAPAERQARASATAKVGAQMKDWQDRICQEIGLIEHAVRQQADPISFVIADLQGGGAQRVLSLVAGELAARGHVISVITLSSPAKDVLHLPASVRRIALGLDDESRSPGGAILANVRRVRALRRALDAVHTGTAVSFVGSTNVLAVLAGLGASWKTVVSERNDPARQSLGRAWDVLRRRVYPLADLVTANSSGALATMRRWMRANRLALVRNPLPPQAYAARPEDAGSRDATILAIGRLHHQKGFDILLDAFAILQRQMPGWRLAVAGSGPLEQDLKRQAAALGIAEKVSWLGFVDAPRPLYAKASIFTLPSRYEGMPNALLEAMAAGCACVVSDASAGPLELVTDGTNGLICPTGDSSALAAALYRLAADPALRHSLGTAAMVTAEDYHLDRVVDHWEELLGLQPVPPCSPPRQR